MRGVERVFVDEDRVGIAGTDAVEREVGFGRAVEPGRRSLRLLRSGSGYVPSFRPGRFRRVRCGSRRQGCRRADFARRSLLRSLRRPKRRCCPNRSPRRSMRRPAPRISSVVPSCYKVIKKRRNSDKYCLSRIKEGLLCLMRPVVSVVGEFRDRITDEHQVKDEIFHVFSDFIL